jgi:hypothetical protein
MTLAEPLTRKEKDSSVDQYVVEAQAIEREEYYQMKVLG